MHPGIKSALETGCMVSESTAVSPSLPRGWNGKAVGSGCSTICHGYKNGILTDPLTVPHLASAWLPVKRER